MARCGIIIIVKVVIPDKLFAGCNVAERKNPDTSLDLIHFAVGIARVIEICTNSMSVDHGLAVLKSV